MVSNNGLSKKNEKNQGDPNWQNLKCRQEKYGAHNGQNKKNENKSMVAQKDQNQNIVRKIWCPIMG